MQNRNRKRAARGFTLIELVIVIAVIAILAALLVPTILGQAERARVSRARSDASEIAKALARMRADTSFHSSTQATADACYALANITATTPPTTCGMTNTDVCDPNDPSKAGLPCWGGPYMSATVANDPWNMPWITSYDVNTRAITVTSYGQNKASGGTPNDDVIVTQ